MEDKKLSLRLCEEGDRVIVNIDAPAYRVKDALGTVTFVYKDALFLDEFCPIQIELDEPYEENGQTMIRATLKEVRVYE